MDEELKAYLEGIKQEILEHIDERTHDAETRIVRAFGAYEDGKSAA